jgi:hypothetical protein
MADFEKLKYWGLIHQQEKDPADTKKRTSGMWAITAKGRQFARGDIKLPSHVSIYNSKALGLDGDDVGIKEVLGHLYDYEEVLNG